MMTSLRILLAASLALLMLTAIGCTEDPLYSSRGVTISAVNLPGLEAGTHYQLWLSYPRDEAHQSKTPGVDIDELRFFSVGSFIVDAEGGIHGIDGGVPTFSIPSGYNPGLLAGAILTIEPQGKSDTFPGARLLAGNIVHIGSTFRAELLMSGSDAFGSSLDSILQTGSDSLISGGARPGSFLLDSPTSPDPNDFTRGIWFVESSGKSASLHLPRLPVNPSDSNWRYEAWLVHHNPSGDSDFISLGRFLRADTSDANRAGPGAGSTPAIIYNTPGEDFVAPGTERNLNDGSYGVVVSLSPAAVTTTRPLVTLLHLDTIPTTTLRFQSIDLSPLPFSGRPVVEITFAQ